MPLRIAIDIRYLGDFGIGTYIRNLVKALAQIDQTNQYLLAATTAEASEMQGIAPNFEVAIYYPPRYRAWEAIGYGWFLRSLGVDLIHMPVNRLPLIMPKPYVVTIHDLSRFLFSESSSYRDTLRLHRFRQGLLQADKVIAVSTATRRDVEQLLNVPSKRIRQVYSAPDPRFLEAPAQDQERRQVLERYQIDSPFLLYAGRIRRHKNITRIVEAFAVVRAELENDPKYHDLRLIIIGDEISKHPEVRRTVLQTRTENSVRFMGFVPFNTLRIFYSAAAAFVFPSLYEGFGLPPLEAMASGTPVVTSNVSSLPEVVADAAMVVNPENVFDIARGIREVLVDNELRQRLIVAGRKQAKSFNWLSTAAQVLDIYQESGRSSEV